MSLSHNGVAPEQLSAALRTAIFVIDKDFRVVYVNPSAEQLMGFSQQKVQGEQLSRSFYDAPIQRKAFEQAFEQGQSSIIREVAILTQQGEHYVDFYITPLKQAGDETQLVVEVHDIDRLKNINKEEQAITVHKSTRKIIRGMAHEIKTPLGGIRGAAQLIENLLQTQGETSSDLLELSEIIITEADRLAQLADQMLGDNHLIEKSHLNIHEAIERVCRLMTIESADTDMVLIRKDYDPSLPEIYGNLNQLIQVLLNIIRNAKQSLVERGVYGQEDACIVIKTRCKHKITLGNQRYRTVLSVAIEDNGMGVTENIQESLFYPLVTARAQGTGLGLSIAQDIISQHNGLIVCNSTAGKTVFTINIPYGEAE